MSDSLPFSLVQQEVLVTVDGEEVARTYLTFRADAVAEGVSPVGPITINIDGKKLARALFQHQVNETRLSAGIRSF